MRLQILLLKIAVFFVFFRLLTVPWIRHPKMKKQSRIPLKGHAADRAKAGGTTRDRKVIRNFDNSVESSLRRVPLTGVFEGTSANGCQRR
ncbi:hypothetical protein [Paenibacillus beijingensis]|uniref:Uncharacterized protein n=1 Tax=Paenibacillus beijingensis TaxID=1126833 RepID=A0A0D5NKQ8_9BACL|nr:hypothetical protein [Paenibacillus beijingensis]AJY75592.1 hypothetical protein VN24_14795 [Paenibacillus beijingensis]